MVMTLLGRDVPGCDAQLLEAPPGGAARPADEPPPAAAQETAPKAAQETAPKAAQETAPKTQRWVDGSPTSSCVS